MDWKKSLLISGKEFVKVVVVSAIPLLVIGLQAGQIDLRALGVAVAIAVLNSVNEFVKKWDGSSYTGIMGQ